MATGWRELRAPDFSTGARLQQEGLRQLQNVTSGLEQLYDQHQDFRRGEVADELMKRVLGYDSPDDLQAAVKSGEITQGLNPKYINSETQLGLLDQIAQARQRQMTDFQHEDYLKGREQKQIDNTYGTWLAQNYNNAEDPKQQQSMLRAGSNLGMSNAALLEAINTANQVNAGIHAQSDADIRRNITKNQQRQQEIAVTEAEQRLLAQQAKNMVESVIPAFNNSDSDAVVGILKNLYEQTFSQDTTEKAVATKAFQDLRAMYPALVDSFTQFNPPPSFGGVGNETVSKQDNGYEIQTDQGTWNIPYSSSFTNIGSTKAQQEEYANFGIFDEGRLLGEVRDYGAEVVRKNNTGNIGVNDKKGNPLGSGAFGPFQITPQTWDEYAPKVLGKDWRKQPSTLESHIAVAEAIYDDRVKSGKKPASKEWTGLGKAGDPRYLKKDGLKGVPFKEVLNDLLRTEASATFTPNQEQQQAQGTQEQEFDVADVLGQSIVDRANLPPQVISASQNVLNVIPRDGGIADRVTLLKNPETNLVKDIPELKRYRKNFDQSVAVGQNKHSVEFNQYLEDINKGSAADSLSELDAKGELNKTLKSNNFKLSYKDIDSAWTYAEESYKKVFGHTPSPQVILGILKRATPQDKLFGSNGYNRKAITTHLETLKQSFGPEADLHINREYAKSEFNNEEAALNEELKQLGILETLNLNPTDAERLRGSITARVANLAKLSNIYPETDTTTPRTDSPSSESPKLTESISEDVNANSSPQVEDVIRMVMGDETAEWAQGLQPEFKQDRQALSAIQNQALSQNYQNNLQKVRGINKAVLSLEKAKRNIRKGSSLSGGVEKVKEIDSLIERLIEARKSPGKFDDLLNQANNFLEQSK